MTLKPHEPRMQRLNNRRFVPRRHDEIDLVPVMVEVVQENLLRLLWELVDVIDDKRLFFTVHRGLTKTLDVVSVIRHPLFF